MLDVYEARQIVKLAIPDGEIQAVVDYKDLFIFQIFTNDPDEGGFDPFYSVNKETGEFRDFSIMDDGNPEIFVLFEQAHGPGL